MKQDLENFANLSTSNQIKFLKEGEFLEWDRKDRILFLKSILLNELSSKTIASTLKLLRELQYHDKYFFRKFMYHVDSSVSNAAKRAINETIERKYRKRTPKIIEQIKKEKNPNKILLIRSLFQDNNRVAVNVILSLLDIDEVSVRETLVKEVSTSEYLNEIKIAEAIQESIWYKRAALVEILGNRRSRRLFDMIDQLLKDANVDVKLKLIHALTRYHRDDVKEYLQVLQKDSNFMVRREAGRILNTI